MSKITVTSRFSLTSLNYVNLSFIEGSTLTYNKFRSEQSDTNAVLHEKTVALVVVISVTTRLEATINQYLTLATE